MRDIVATQLSSAWVALRKAQTVQETKKVLDAVTAAGVYAKRQGLSDQIIGAAHSIRIYALRQLGKMLEQQPNVPGPGRGKKGVQPDDSFSVRTLAALGIDKNTSSLAQRVASLPPVKVAALADRKLTLEDVRRYFVEQHREQRRQQNRDLVTSVAAVPAAAGERYQTVVLDPPWDWGDEGDMDQLGRARPTYSTMPLEEIAALPVSEMAAPNSHLYLWITNRSLPKGFGLLEAWGFRYVTTLTWVKPTFGMGNYFRGSTEHVLFGVQGSLSLLRKDIGTHFFAERTGEHSTKPPEFYALVETCSPGPWLELFARHPRPGWVTWGAEVKDGQTVLV